MIRRKCLKSGNHVLIFFSFSLALALPILQFYRLFKANVVRCSRVLVKKGFTFGLIPNSLCQLVHFSFKGLRDPQVLCSVGWSSFLFLGDWVKLLLFWYFLIERYENLILCQEIKLFLPINSCSFASLVILAIVCSFTKVLGIIKPWKSDGKFTAHSLFFLARVSVFFWDAVFLDYVFY